MSYFQDDLAPRVTRFACFMSFRRAIERKFQAHRRPELPFVSQLAKKGDVASAMSKRDPIRSELVQEWVCINARRASRNKIRRADSVERPPFACVILRRLRLGGFRSFHRPEIEVEQ